MKVVKKIMIGIIIFIIVTIVIYSFFEKLIIIMHKIELPISIFTKVDYYNNFDEWNEGYEYDTFYLTEKQKDRMVKRIKENQKWKDKFPLDDLLKSQINTYSMKIDTSGMQNVKNGYWLFLNLDERIRNEDSYNYNKYAEQIGDGLPRIILSVLDTDNNLLYFYELIA